MQKTIALQNVGFWQNGSKEINLAHLSGHAPADPIASFDNLAIRNHVELLHQTARGSDGKFVVSVFNGDSPSTITHHKIGDINGMVEAVSFHASTPGANVYCGLHLMRSNLPRGKRGSKSDVVSVLGLVADMDADTGKVGKMPAESSYVVETSPGNCQPVIVFDQPLSPADAEVLAKALQRATGSDFGTGDIAHVWRIPGTLNYPNAGKIARGRSPEPVAVFLQTAFVGEVYSKEKLTEILSPFICKTASGERAIFKSSVDTAPLLQRLSDIGHAVLISDGQPDRSAQAARVVEQLHFEGFTLDETISLCLERPGAWTEKYRDDPALIKDIERCWEKFAAPKDAEALANAEAVEHWVHDNDNDAAAATPVQSTLPRHMAWTRPAGW